MSSFAAPSDQQISQNVLDGLVVTCCFYHLRTLLDPRLSLRDQTCKDVVDEFLLHDELLRHAEQS